MNFPLLFIFFFLIFIPTTLSHAPKFRPKISSPSISFSTRIHHRRQPLKTSRFSASKIFSDTHPTEESVVAMRLGIGSNSTNTPMLTTELIVDTGSSLTWLQALPCYTCYDQHQIPFYNQFDSETYAPVNCADEICRAIPRAIHNNCPTLQWTSDEPCSYRTEYLDGTTSRGIIGTETFYFQDAHGVGNESIPFVPFGLGTSNVLPDELELNTPGILGLTRGSGTFLNKLRVTKFSHCFPRDENDTGILRFGSEARIIGDKVALISSSVFYMAHLTNVYVSGKAIPMGEYDLPVEMIFDSGMAESALEPGIMDAVLEAIKNALWKYQPRQEDDLHYQLCYDLIELCSVSLDEVAKITFEFNYSTKVDLFSFHLWKRYRDRNLICLGLGRASRRRNFFGNNLMREINIGYSLHTADLAMYFNRQRCWR